MDIFDRMYLEKWYVIEDVAKKYVEIVQDMLNDTFSNQEYPIGKIKEFYHFTGEDLNKKYGEKFNIKKQYLAFSPDGLHKERLNEFRCFMGDTLFNKVVDNHLRKTKIHDLETFLVTRKIINSREYPKGSRIKLLEMDDIQAPPVNTMGTVLGVDDMGDILMRWDNGSHLKLITGVDKFEKID